MEEKQIEELAKDIGRGCADLVYGSCKDDTCRTCLAKHLIRQGWCKITKNEVVISKEEYEKMKSLYECQKGAFMTSSIGDLPLTVEGLRKAVDEISRLRKVEVKLKEGQTISYTAMINSSYLDRIEELENRLLNIQKETAKEIFNALYKDTIREGRPAVYNMLTPNKIKDMAKQYGVEIGEDK